MYPYGRSLRRERAMRNGATTSIANIYYALMTAGMVVIAGLLIASLVALWINTSQLSNIKSDVLNITATETNISLNENMLPYTIMGGVTGYPISAGELTGFDVIHKFGYNQDIDTTFETIWSAGGLYPYLSTADNLRVVSTDVDDATGGAGARVVRIYGLDENGNEITDDVQMDGTNTVDTTKKFLRVFRGRVVSAGSSGFNEGLITASAVTGATLQMEILSETSSTQMGIYSVPVNMEAYLLSFTISSESSSGGGRQHISLYTHNNGIVTLRGDWGIRGGATSTFAQQYDIPLRLDPLTDIEFRASSTSSGAKISVYFIMLLREI